MNKLNESLLNAFDDNVLVKTVFQHKNGKLKIIKKKIELQSTEKLKPQAFFPISKERK